jgi:hypothetical protein
VARTIRGFEGWLEIILDAQGKTERIQINFKLFLG